MWLMTIDGFFSVVEDADDPGFVVVRARDEASQTRLIAAVDEGELTATPAADYGFRVVLSRDVWTAYLQLAAEALDYRNFKAAASEARPDEGFAAFLHNCWLAGRAWQAGKPLTYDRSPQ